MMYLIIIHDLLINALLLFFRQSTYTAIYLAIAQEFEFYQLVTMIGAIFISNFAHNTKMSKQKKNMRIAY